MMKRLLAFALALTLAFTLTAALAEGATHAAGDARPHYTLDVTLDTERDRLSESVTIAFQNDSDAVWDAVWLTGYVPVVLEHAQPGAYSAGVVTVADGETGEPLAFSEDRELGLITVTPAKPLEPGQSMSLALAYEADIPHVTNERYQVSGYKRSNGVTYKLCQFFPMLCVFKDGQWVHHAYEFGGEAFFTVCSDFDVTLRLPQGITVVASGEEEQVETDGDQAVWQITARNMRDMVIIASSEYKKPYTGTVGDVTVNSYYATSHQSKQAEWSLQAAMKSVALFEEKFGKYPYSELDVCITQMIDAAVGIEYPGLVEIEQLAEVTRSHVRTIVSHEVGHQWFYGVVGNDQYDEPFLDEAFAFYCQVVYMRHIDKKTERELQDIVVLRDKALPVDLSLDEYKAIAGEGYLDAYSMAVYRSGREFLWKVERAMGEKAFTQMISQWYNEQMFKTPTIDEFVEFLYGYTGHAPEIEALVAQYMKRAGAQ